MTAPINRTRAYAVCPNRETDAMPAIIMNAPLPPIPTKQEIALNAACELFTVDRSLVECLQAYQDGWFNFYPFPGSPMKSCEDHIGELAEEAYRCGELCRAAKLYALSGLAYHVDVILRGVLVKGRKGAAEGMAKLCKLTPDAERELDIAEDAVSAAKENIQ